MPTATFTTPAEPCTKCGTTGGFTPACCHRPHRKRGLCCACYNRLKYHGRLDVYPLALARHGFTACLGCGTARPHWYYGRGLCVTCYARARSQGVSARYPACGPVPVPLWEHGRDWADHPTVPDHTVPAAALGWPAAPAVGVTDHLARWDRPNWAAAVWTFRPRDPGFAAYFDRDTATRAVA